MRQLIDLRQVRATDTAEKQQDKDIRLPSWFRCQNGGSCRQVILVFFPRQLGHQSPSHTDGLSERIVTLYQSLICAFLIECREESLQRAACRHRCTCTYTPDTFG